jgi:dual specificity phosphatase 12
MRPLISGVADLTMSSLSMSALETEDDSGPEDGAAPSPPAPADGQAQAQQEPLPSTHAFEAAARLGRRLSDAVLASPADMSPPEPTPDASATHFSSTDDIAAQLFANPKLRSSMMMSPLTPLGSPKAHPVSPPILANPKCSGYFVEPVRSVFPLLSAIY